MRPTGGPLTLSQTRHSGSAMLSEMQNRYPSMTVLHVGVVSRLSGLGAEDSPNMENISAFRPKLSKWKRFTTAINQKILHIKELICSVVQKIFTFFRRKKISTSQEHGSIPIETDTRRRLSGQNTPTERYKITEELDANLHIKVNQLLTRVSDLKTKKPLQEDCIIEGFKRVQSEEESTLRDEIQENKKKTFRNLVHLVKQDKKIGNKNTILAALQLAERLGSNS